MFRHPELSYSLPALPACLKPSARIRLCREELTRVAAAPSEPAVTSETAASNSDESPKTAAATAGELGRDLLADQSPQFKRALWVWRVYSNLRDSVMSWRRIERRRIQIHKMMAELEAEDRKLARQQTHVRPTLESSRVEWDKLMAENAPLVEFGGETGTKWPEKAEEVHARCRRLCCLMEVEHHVSTNRMVHQYNYEDADVSPAVREKVRRALNSGAQGESMDVTLCELCGAILSCEPHYYM